MTSLVRTPNTPILRSSETSTPLIRLHRSAVLNVMHKFITEMLGKAADGEDGGVGEGADSAACHLVTDGIQQIQVFHAAFAFYDAVDDAVEPAGTFTAGGALTAGFVVVEIA